MNGGSDGIRTHDPRLKRPLLYRLSYTPQGPKIMRCPRYEGQLPCQQAVGSLDSLASGMEGE